MSLPPGAFHKQKRLSEGSSLPESLSGKTSQSKEEFNWEWYDPPEGSIFVDYCNDTSLHGIQYMGQEGRHMFERLFWFLATLAAGIYGTVFIWRMWTEYVNMPIVTVFNPTEKTLAEIPFPAVTICNVNNIRKSRANEYKMDALKNSSVVSMDKNYQRESYLHTLASISDVNHICESKKTFSERFTLDVPQVEKLASIESEIEKNKDMVEYYMNPTNTLRKGSQPCHEMILFCLWLDEIRNCSELFQEIETDFGICCTFNMIPLSLLRKFNGYRGDVKDDPQRVEDWKSANLNYDNLIFDLDHDNGRKYPFRQVYPGRSAGLSFLLDPDLEEYDCTNTDSEGFMASLNVPLDFPRFRDSNAIAVPTNAEVFISVTPEVTMSDESVRSYSLDKRRCYFGEEYVLPHYTKYTASNCMDECIARTTYQVCKCKQHYMPRGKNESLCSSQNQHKCTDQVRKRIIQTGLNKECSYCLPSCTEIDYYTETTFLRIQRKSVTNLMKQYPNYSFDNLSIVHVYFNVDATYPRLRQEFTSVIDLIANAGGLLGFCMGFSILSVLEVVYFLTIRMFFKFYRSRSERNRSGFFYNYNQIVIVVIIMIAIIVLTYYLRNVIAKPS